MKHKLPDSLLNGSSCLCLLRQILPSCVTRTGWSGRWARGPSLRDCCAGFLVLWESLPLALHSWAHRAQNCRLLFSAPNTESLLWPLQTCTFDFFLITSHSGFDVISLIINVLSIFIYTPWPFAFLLGENTCSCLLPIYKLKYLFLFPFGC